MREVTCKMACGPFSELLISCWCRGRTAGRNYKIFIWQLADAIIIIYFLSVCRERTVLSMAALAAEPHELLVQKKGFLKNEDWWAVWLGLLIFSLGAGQIA